MGYPRPVPDEPARGAVDTPRPPRVRWATRMLLLLSAALVVALPALWVASQYNGSEVAGALSYPVRDGWCEAGVFPGLGAHCFGDYTGQVLTARHDFGLPGFDPSSHPYAADPSLAYNSLYTPVGQFPHVVADLLLGAGFGSGRTFYLFIFLLLVAAAAPALWLAWQWRRSPFLVVPLIVIGVAAVPVIAVVDRGNSAGFVIPLLLGFALFAGKDPPWMAPGFVTAAALVRPQFILLALALVALRRWRQAVAAVAAFVAITVPSFALTAGGLTAGLSAWWSNVTGFRGVADLTIDVNANISLARGVVITGNWLAQWPGAIGAFGGWLSASAITYPLGVVIIAAVAFLLVVLAAGASLPRSVALFIPLVIAGTASTISPSYYLMFALVIAAVVMGSRIAGSRDEGAFDAEGATGWPGATWRWMVLAAVTLSLVPIPWGGGTVGIGPAWVHSWLLRHIAVAWLLVVAAGLAWAFARALRAGGVRPVAGPPADVP